jgi:hypothetical protein
MMYTSRAGGGVGPDHLSAWVAIYRLLQKQAFGPEDMKRMGEAYEFALVALNIGECKIL